MELRRCDRCGKVSETNKNYKFWNAKRFFGSNIDPADLCHNCVEELHAWFAAGRNDDSSS